MKRSLAVLLPAAALALSACGLKGDLERPVPLWGNPPNEGPTDPRTIKAQEEEEARRKAAEAAAEEAERKAEEAGATAQPASPQPPPQ